MAVQRASASEVIRLRQLHFQQRPPQPARSQKGCLDVDVARAFFEEDQDFAIGALPRIAELQPAGPVPEGGAAPGAANLDGIGHLRFQLRVSA
jgi:hypothetical protein